MLSPSSPPAELDAATAAALAQALAFKVLLIDAICGVGFPSQLLGHQCELAGLAAWDAQAAQYQWRRNALAKNPLEKLQALYQALVEAREDERREMH